MSSSNVVFHIRVNALYDFVSSGAAQAWVTIFSPDFVVKTVTLAVSIR